MGVVIAGERSGAGKTTVTLALLAFLAKKGARVQSFKVGPDYIDPMFHHHVTRRPCRNLDPLLTSETYVQACFAHHCRDVDYALVEGVMGLFDGAAGRGDFASTAHVARSLDLPVVLVVDCSRLSHSIAALVQGYRSFDPRLKFAGVVLNRVGSDRHRQLLTDALDGIAVPILGVLGRDDRVQIPDRHLGLVPTAELPEINRVVDQLAHLGATCFDWSQLLPLLAPVAKSIPLPGLPKPEFRVRLAVAQDAAFSFYYPDNLDRLQELGAELILWSPLQDRSLPEGVQGLYLGGGFPEMFATQLSENRSMVESVRNAILAGMPTYAECGGLMYLCETLAPFEGDPVPLVGILPTTARMGSRLTLGYRQAIAQRDTPLVAKGTIVHAHEFHRSTLTQESSTPIFEFDSFNHPASKEGWHCHQLHASYLHLHWGATPELPQRFLRSCDRSS